MAMLIGAQPPTAWLAGELALDEEGFVFTGPAVGRTVARRDVRARCPMGRSYALC